MQRVGTLRGLRIPGQWISLRMRYAGIRVSHHAYSLLEELDFLPLACGSRERTTARAARSRTCQRPATEVGFWVAAALVGI